jgi:hypothetical protein
LERLSEEIVPLGLFEETIGDPGCHGVGGPLDRQTLVGSDGGKEPSGFQKAPRGDLMGVLPESLGVDHPA